MTFYMMIRYFKFFWGHSLFVFFVKKADNPGENWHSLCAAFCPFISVKSGQISGVYCCQPQCLLFYTTTWRGAKVGNVKILHIVAERMVALLFMPTCYSKTFLLKQPVTRIRSQTLLRVWFQYFVAIEGSTTRWVIKTFSIKVDILEKLSTYNILYWLMSLTQSSHCIQLEGGCWMNTQRRVWIW